MQVSEWLPIAVAGTVEITQPLPSIVPSPTAVIWSGRPLD